METLQIKNMFCDILIQCKRTRLEYLSGYILNKDLQAFEVEPLRREIIELEKIRGKGL